MVIKKCLQIKFIIRYKISNLLVPLFYQQHINQDTQIAIWKIEEDEHFFLQKVQLQREISNLQKRLQHLAARYLLCYLYDDFSLNRVVVSENGKPFLPNAEYHFSISHSKNFAAVIISKTKNVALDIEMLDNKVERIINKFLNETEKQQMLQTIKNKGFEYLPTLLWSAKETMFKFYAEGNVDFKTMLRIDIDSLNEQSLNALIDIDKTKISLNILYKILNEICITYAIES